VPPQPLAPDIESVRAAFSQLEVLELIGAGGMGAVFKARQPQLDRFVALKILAPERTEDAPFAERFQREAQALARLSHPHIVTIHDFGKAGPFYFLLMEFVDGVNLRDATEAARLTPEQALSIVPPICDALEYAHERGIVHRDIKPENLLLDKQGRVKIADFGIARILGTDEEPLASGPRAGALTQADALGTPAYMAPEQCATPQSVDHRADIYSLGVVFYEMLTGELPQDRITPPSLKVALDVRLDEVVLRTLEKLPELRYQQASHVKTALETIVMTSAPVDTATSKAGPVHETVPSFPSIKRRISAWLTTIGLLLCVAAWWAASSHRDGLRRKWFRPARAQQPAAAAPKATTSPRAKTGFEQWQPTQIAKMDPSTGALVVESPDGGWEKVLGVCSANEPNQWWSADGRPLTYERFEIKGAPGPGNDHFILYDNRGSRSDGGTYSAPDADNFEPKGILRYMSPVTQDGKILRGVYVQRWTFPEGARAVTLRTTVGLEKWRTISVLNRDTNRYKPIFTPGDPEFKLHWVNHVNTDRGVQVTVTLHADPKFWAILITAIDNDGVRYEPRSRGGGSYLGNVTLCIYKDFVEAKREWTKEEPPTLPLSEIMEFRAEVQPVYFVEFRDIALQPRESIVVPN
jgi:serine/threonine protein kinase